MPIYSEIIADNKILNLLGDSYKDTLIVGCGGCTNESLSFKNKTPIAIKYKQNEKLEPYSVTVEVKRIAKLLLKQGFGVKCQVIPENNLLCMRDINKTAPLILMKNSFDVILALCCPAGIFGLRKIVGNGIPIIKITKQFGFLYYVYEENQNQKKIIYNYSTVISESIVDEPQILQKQEG